MQQKIINFFSSNNNIVGNSYFWNMVSGLLNAGQSVILLIIISRTRGLEDAGIFSIAYAIASLMLTIGCFGMRNYQATDTRESYTYNEYLTSRFITSIVMILISFVYIIKGRIFDNYSFYKMSIITLVCALKLFDAIQDIFEGRCQQNGRLDVAAKCLGIRYMVAICSICFFLIITKSLLISLIISVVISLFIIIWYIKNIFCDFGEIKLDKNINKIKGLLFECLPLFAGAYLSLYIGNAPKYAIDAVMDSEKQACFNFVFMPVFVVGLLNNFIYQPILSKLSVQWNNKKIKKFVLMVWRQFLIIIGIMVIVLAGGYLLGIPVLSVLYNTDLSTFKSELLILLFGGGMLAYAGFLNVIITIMRKQKWLLIGYGIVAFIAMLSSKYVVINYGTIGAAWLYTILMIILSIIFGSMLFVFIRKNKN